MKRKKAFKFSVLTASVAAFAILLSGIFCSIGLPDTFNVTEGSQLTFANNRSLTAETCSKSGAVQAGSILRAGNQYSSELKLLGIIPVKKVTVNVVRQTYVVPCGQAFGVKLYTKGVMVVGMTDVDGDNGSVNPAYNAGIRIGDVIMAINGKPVYSNSEVSKLFEASGGKSMKINVVRDNCAYIFNVKPVKSRSAKTYKAGIWVRDSTAGIGTLTFYVPSKGAFCGLGHGICDVDTGEILPLLEGDICKVKIESVVKGQKGEPGELKGTFLKDSLWGELLCNCETGIYGVLDSKITGKEIPVALKQQVHTGPATILVTLNGASVAQYSINIEKVHFNDSEKTKNMVIRVTDKKLLSLTGGIVQGMSGSPIIQDGMLAGAVTHVFVNDPQKGYGIFAENMINTLNNIEITKENVVS